MPRKAKVKAREQRMEIISENKRRHMDPTRREAIEKDQQKNMANDSPLN